MVSYKGDGFAGTVPRGGGERADETKDEKVMLRTRRLPQRGGALAAMLLSLLIFLVACGGSASPTVAPTATPPPPTAVAVAPTATVAPPTPTLPAPTATPPATSVVASSSSTAPAPAATVAPTATSAPTATAPPPTATAAPRAGQPVRLQIPSIKVNAAIEYVGLTADGDMDTPKDYNDTAWYEPGPRPGEVGNAAIAGHVDSKTGPAVFWYLAKLKPGDEVFVVGDDGVTRRFVVAALASYGRTDAPLQQIFGPTGERHLNIITCDSSTPFTNGHYAANIVVYTNYAP